MIMEGQTLGMILAEGRGLGVGMARPLSSSLHYMHMIM